MTHVRSHRAWACAFASSGLQAAARPLLHGTRVGASSGKLAGFGKGCPLVGC